MSDTPHILIVDDHRSIRDAVTRYLERNGIPHHDGLSIGIGLPGGDHVRLALRLLSHNGLKGALETTSPRLAAGPGLRYQPLLTFTHVVMPDAACASIWQ